MKNFEEKKIEEISGEEKKMLESLRYDNSYAHNKIIIEKKAFVISYKISIIIPIYNVENYLSDCLKSVLSQTYQNLEILCVNDGSTDKSLEILQHYAAKDSRIRVFDKPNGGVSSARNVGLQNATGKYLMFVDADDHIAINACEILIKIATINDTDIIVFGAKAFPDFPRIPEWINEIIHPSFEVYEQFKPEILFEKRGSRPFLWMHFVNRKLFETKPKLRFNEKLTLGEDQALQFLYFPRANRIIFIEDVLYNYRWFRQGSIMYLNNNKLQLKLDKHFTLIDEIAATWSEAGYFESMAIEFFNWAVGFLHDDIIQQPYSKQEEYANLLLEIEKKYGLNANLLYESESSLYKQIMNVERNKVNYDLLVNKHQATLNTINEEILLALKSTTFKLGRLFTPIKKRIKKPNKLISKSL